MTRNPALRPTRPGSSHRDFCASFRRIAFTAAAGFAAVFLATLIFWR